MIHAFNNFKLYNDDFILVLAGSGPLELKLRKLISKLKLQDHIFFTGLISKDEVFSFLNYSHIYCMPSLSEGLNVSFLEALAMNIRIIVSDIKQFSEPLSIWDKNSLNLNVFMCDPLSVHSISHCFQMANDSLLLRFNSEFININHMINKYKKLYYKYINE